MKKICFVTPNVFPVPAVKGGAVETLVNNLIDENEKNKLFDFYVVSIYEKEAVKLSENYKSTKFKYISVIGNNFFEKLKAKFTKKTFIDKVIRKLLRLPSYIYAYKVYKYAKKLDIDYLIIEGGDLLSYKKILRYIGKDKCIGHLHGIGPGSEELNNNYSNFIAVSEYTKNKFIENGIIDKNRVHVLINAIDLKKFNKKVEESEKIKLRKKYNINDNEIVIMFCGRIIPEKGVMELIKALKKMKNFDRCKLLIVGNSQFANNVFTEYNKKLIEETKDIMDKIVFTGFINNNELYKIHSISDISAIPSMWEEACCLVMFESLADGIPVVATDSGGTTEVLNEECSFVIKRDENLIKNMANAIDCLVENEELRKKMGEKGRKIAENYSQEKYFVNFYKLIENLD